MDDKLTGIWALGGAVSFTLRLKPTGTTSFIKYLTSELPRFLPRSEPRQGLRLELLPCYRHQFFPPEFRLFSVC